MAALLAALIAFRGPLMNLVGPEDPPPEEGAPAEAPSFEVSTPGAADGVVPEGAGEVGEVGEAEEPSAASRQFMPQEEQQAADAAAPDDSAAAEPAGPISTETAEAAAAEQPLPAPPTPAVETEPAAEPAAVSRPLVPAAPAPPVNATALRSITASTAGDRTVVEIVGNAPFQRHHVMSLEGPPRLLVRLIGVRQDFDAGGVGGPGLRGVRTGVHGRGATRNLHVVLDLTASDVAATVERRGDRVVVNLTH